MSFFSDLDLVSSFGPVSARLDPNIQFWNDFVKNVVFLCCFSDLEWSYSRCKKVVQNWRCVLVVLNWSPELDERD